jgi:hypothetical protein
MHNDETQRELDRTRMELEAATAKNEQLQTVKKQLEEKIETLKLGFAIGDISNLDPEVQADIARRQREFYGPNAREIAIECALRQQRADTERLGELTAGEQKQVAVLVEKRHVSRPLAVAVIRHQRAVIRAQANGEEGYPHPIYAAEFLSKPALAKA